MELGEGYGSSFKAHIHHERKNKEHKKIQISLNCMEWPTTQTLPKENIYFVCNMGKYKERVGTRVDRQRNSSLLHCLPPFYER